ncbi:RluA family pseudouridine synthase [Candidatus Hepatincolaceae symbiont of Richtersius coronifer]
MSQQLLEETISYFMVSQLDHHMRLDKWLLTNFKNLTNATVQKLIRTGQIRIDGKRANFDFKLQENQKIRIPMFIVNSYAPLSLKETYNKKVNLDLVKNRQYITTILNSILYKDEDFIIINKPVGLAVQGGSKIGFNLTSAFEYLKFEKEEVPYIVHRIDKETSGILVLARHKEASRFIAEKFRSKDIKKMYSCLVAPLFKKSSGVIAAPLIKMANLQNQKMIIDEKNGKEAITQFEVKSINNEVGYLMVSPITGRTHQIRVHMANVLNAPILGDFKYGFTPLKNIKLDYKRLYLHATSVEFKSLDGNKIAITAPFEEEFQEMLDILEF